MNSQLIATVLTLVAVLGSIMGCVYCTALLSTYVGVMVADRASSKSAAQGSHSSQRSFA